MATEPADPDLDAADHSLKATHQLAAEIREALEETGIGEDVWQTITDNEPDNPKGTCSFTLEGDDGLYYSVQVMPLDEAPDED